MFRLGLEPGTACFSAQVPTDRATPSCGGGVTHVLAGLSGAMQEVVSMHILISLHPYRVAETNKLLLPELYERYRSHLCFPFLLTGLITFAKQKKALGTWKDAHWTWRVTKHNYFKSNIRKSISKLTQNLKKNFYQENLASRYSIYWTHSIYFKLLYILGD